MIATLRTRSLTLAKVLGAVPTPPDGQYVTVKMRDGGSPLFWSLDPKLVEEARAI